MVGCLPVVALTAVDSAETEQGVGFTVPITDPAE